MDASSTSDSSLKGPSSPEPLRTSDQREKASEFREELPPKLRREVSRLDDVDGMAHQFRVSTRVTPVSTPKSTGFDTAFLPFVLDSGVLSLSTPPDSSSSGSEPEYDTDLPTTAVTSSFGDFTDPTYYHASEGTAFLQTFSIWRGDDSGPTHVYVQMFDPHPPSDDVPLNVLDFSSLMRYGLLRAAFSHHPCEFIHLDMPLVPTLTACNDLSLVNSVITISSQRRRPIRLLVSLYDNNIHRFSFEAQMEEDPYPSSSGRTSHTTSLPQEFINRILGDLDCSDKAVVSPKPSFLDMVVVMRFLQQEDAATNEEEDVLVVVTDFRVVESSLPAEVKVSRLLPENPSSRDPQLPTPLSEHNFHPDTMKSARLRSAERPIPKLSVAIPPSSLPGIEGVQVYTNSPESAARRTPHTGVPHNVFPVTPFDPLIPTPQSLLKSESESAYSRSSYVPTSSESAYPFTLSTTSPGPAPSPAFAVVDSNSGAESAPAWLSTVRDMTPFTPSFFMQPLTSSDNVNPFIRRTLDARGSLAARYKERFDISPVAVVPSLPQDISKLPRMGEEKVS